jgi:hypothetical protein
VSGRGRAPVVVWREAIAESGLSSTQKAVAWALSLRMNGACEAWPSVPTLARYASFSVRAVQAALRALVDATYLEVVEEGGNGRRLETTIYRGVILGQRVNQMHPSTGERVQGIPRRVHLTTSKGERAAPEVGDELDTEVGARGGAADAAAGALERWLANVGVHFTHDADAFAEEVARFGVAIDGAEQLRTRLLEEATC